MLAQRRRRRPVRGVARDRPGQLVHGSREILRERARAAALEELEQTSVVPELIAGRALTEAIPQDVALLAVVAHERAGVVDLVRERHPQHGIVADLRKVREVALLAHDPGLIRLAPE